MAPVWRLQVPDVIACERSERASSDTASSSVASRPPSPDDRILFEKNENAPAMPQVPSLRPSTVADGACATSSISASPCLSHSSRSSAILPG